MRPVFRIVLGTFGPIAILLMALKVNALADYSETEKWVAEQVAKGEYADVANHFGPDQRELGSKFIDALIGGSPATGKPQRQGVVIVGANFPERIDLDYQDVDWPVRMVDCSFLSALHAVGTHFKKLLSFENCAFSDDCDLRSCHARELILENSGFSHNLNLHAAAIEERFYAPGLVCVGQSGTFDCSSMVVGGDLTLDNSTFKSSVKFNSAKIVGDFRSDEGHYLSENVADFSTFKVEGYGRFTYSEFAGAVRFHRADFEKSLYFDHAILRGTTCAAGETPNYFRGIRVGDDGFFKATQFFGKVDFEDSSFNIIELQEVRWAEKDMLSLKGAKYTAIHLSGTYDDQETWKLIHPLLKEASNFSLSSYKAIADSFGNTGEVDLANEAYIAGRNDECRRDFMNHNWSRWLWNQFVGRLLGYGREPWRAIFPAIAFVLIGAFVFRRGSMQVSNKRALDPGADMLAASDDPPYHPFMYSLGSFLPVIDLFVKEWQPKPAHRWVRHYLCIHILAGWLLVPLALASVTGLLK